MVIDKTTHEITPVHYRKIVTAKTQILISSTLRANGNHIIRWNNMEFGKSKKWSTYSITRAGKVYQHYDPKYQTDFLGIKDADSKLISISLENMGFLTKLPSGEYVNWLNETCTGEIVKKTWLGYDYWEEFTVDQMNSLIDLCLYLCDTFNIPKKCIEFNHYHKDINKFRGIIFRSNYIENTNDVNPLFDITAFSGIFNTET